MIFIQNIYYMLSYAFQALNRQGIKEVDVESFDNIQQLCAEILIKGVNTEIKRGLEREYIPTTEPLASVKGKIDVSDSIKTRSLLRRRIVCSYDEFSENTKLNQIVKTTLILLLKSDIKKEQKKAIKSILIFYANVDEVDIYHIDWNYHYNRNNQSYQLLIAICNMVVKGLLQTQSDGSIRLLDFLDEQRMSRLYEKFILEYYRRHFPELSANASFIPWQLDTDERKMLPIMKSDIMLHRENNYLIIDAKYYGQNTQMQYDKPAIHSRNLYQIFTYVKNKDRELEGKEHCVSGLLLYAQTDNDIQPDVDYVMSGNRIGATTLDMNTSFSEISRKLDYIASDYFHSENRLI